VDENVDPAMFGRLRSVFLTRGLGCPVGVEYVHCVGLALGRGVGPAGLWVRALGKYLDPAGDRDRCGPQNQAYGGSLLKFPGTVLVSYCARGHE